MEWRKILGSTNSDSLSNVRKKYHRLALKHHPNKGGNTKAFQQLGQAWENAQQFYSMATNTAESLDDRVEMRFKLYTYTDILGAVSEVKNAVPALKLRKRRWSASELYALVASGVQGPPSHLRYMRITGLQHVSTNDGDFVDLSHAQSPMQLQIYIWNRFYPGFCNGRYYDTVQKRFVDPSSLIRIQITIETNGRQVSSRCMPVCLVSKRKRYDGKQLYRLADDILPDSYHQRYMTLRTKLDGTNSHHDVEAHMRNEFEYNFQRNAEAELHICVTLWNQDPPPVYYDRHRREFVVVVPSRSAASVRSSHGFTSVKSNSAGNNNNNATSSRNNATNIIHPKTGRKIKRTSPRGRILAALAAGVRGSRTCASDEICNPATQKCVKKDSEIGRFLLRLGLIR